MACRTIERVCTDTNHYIHSIQMKERFVQLVELMTKFLDRRYGPIKGDDLINYVLVSHTHFFY